MPLYQPPDVEAVLLWQKRGFYCLETLSEVEGLRHIVAIAAAYEPKDRTCSLRQAWFLVFGICSQIV
jgi:hypothetical protein